MATHHNAQPDGASRALNPEQELLNALRGVAFVAAARGVAEQSVRAALVRAREIERKTGSWPSGLGAIPKPVVDGRGFEVKWDSRDPAFTAYVRPRPSRYPQLYDKAWLQARYRPGVSIAAIARELGCSRAYVTMALERAGIPVEDTNHATYALHDVPLADLEADLERAGSLAGLARQYGRTPETVRRALRRKRAEASGGQGELARTA